MILPKEYQIIGRRIRILGGSIGEATRFNQNAISVVFDRGPHSLKLRYLVKWHERGRQWSFQ